METEAAQLPAADEFEEVLEDDFENVEFSDEEPDGEDGFEEE